MQTRFRVAILFAITYGAFVQVAYNSPPQVLPEWQRSKLEFPETAPRPTVPKMMIAGLRLANVQIILEKTELTEVQKRLGGAIVGSGDASEANASLCYYGSDANGRWVLWLDSSEIAGLRWIDGFTLRQLGRDVKADRRCRMIPEREGGIELPIRLRLGQTEFRVREVLGKPTLRYHSTLMYYYEHEKTIRNEPCSVLNSVDVALRDGVAWAIVVFKSTQC